MTFAHTRSDVGSRNARRPSPEGDLPKGRKRSADSAVRSRIAEATESWPLPIHKHDHTAESEPMARGEWPSFCVEAMRLWRADRRGRNGRNARVAAKLGVAATTIRRAVGSFPSIVAFADGSKTVARELALIPFASAVIIANWAKRDRKAALAALRECARGMGTAALAAQERASRSESEARWKPIGTRALRETAKAHPGVPLWALRAREMLNDLATCRANERTLVIQAHETTAGTPIKLAGAALQEALRRDADTAKVVGLPPRAARVAPVPLDPDEAGEAEALANALVRRIARRRLAAQPKAGNPAKRASPSKRREVAATWPLKGSMPKGSTDWLTAGHWHLIAQDALKSKLAPTKFAAQKGMLAGTLGIAIRTLVDAATMAGGDRKRALGLSRLSTAAVRTLKALHDRDRAKADAIIDHLDGLGHSSVLVKALANDAGVKAEDVAGIARDERKAA